MARANTKTVQEASPAAVSRFMAQVYLVMGLGLVVTALVAGWVTGNMNLMIRVATNPWLAWGLFIVQIIIVVALSGAVMRMNAGVAFLLFVLYAALTGVTLSTLFLVYTQEEIASVFWLAAGTFVLTSLFALITKRDLTGAGNFLFMLLIGWMFAWIISWFWPSSNFNWALNFIGIALFVGLTAYDTNRLKQIGAQVETHPARGGLVVVGALALYLDFINLFLLLLRASRR
ncbi:MAG: Inner membrane protein YbhL [Anaerolineae bacterium]|nr:Inner membrane protein YbhL [Anaerolineae bacterium]MDL1896715.1 Bax inhibitor-1/YccA family protein [Anaerolineae bacterium CFX7]RIK33417.1 MAG: hypothetical protein DCC52_03325 [Chloroflexota bacterium]